MFNYNLYNKYYAIEFNWWFYQYRIRNLFSQIYILLFLIDIAMLLLDKIHSIYFLMVILYHGLLSMNFLWKRMTSYYNLYRNLFYPFYSSEALLLSIIWWIKILFFCLDIFIHWRIRLSSCTFQQIALDYRL